jgi:hypothetical protein
MDKLVVDMITIYGVFYMGKKKITIGFNKSKKKKIEMKKNPIFLAVDL